MRQQRMVLQNEVDKLTQSLNQSLLTLTDNTRGMFNDRKMAVREEQKNNDSAVGHMFLHRRVLLLREHLSKLLTMSGRAHRSSRSATRSASC